MIIFIQCLILILISEFILRDDIPNISYWVSKHFNSFIFNVILLFPIMGMIALIFHNNFIGFFIVGLIMLVASFASYQTLYYRDEYICFQHFKLFFEAKDIATHIKAKLTNSMIVSLIIFVVTLIISCLNKFENHISFIFSIFAIILLLLVQLIFVVITTNNNLLKKILFIKVDISAENMNYVNNGFLLTFINKLQELFIKEPEGYKKSLIDNILKDIDVKPTSESKANIIFIMNESFFDPNIVENFKTNIKPIPYFQTIQDFFARGIVVTPVTGGATSQPEYESLTGNSVDFITRNTDAFLTYANENCYGLPKILKKLGYFAISFHPYLAEFYKRNQVYKNMKFDKSLFLDSFKDCEKMGDFVSDKDVYKKLINEYENRDINKPFYAHVVTMQNHAGYSKSRVYHGVHVENKDLSEDEKNMVDNYLNLIRESDKALKFLVDYFNEQNEPTVVLMFGDHQPFHKIGFETIDKMNLRTKNADDYLNLYQTPLMVWNNYGLPPKDFGFLDSQFISPVLLDYLGIKTDLYFNFLFECYKELPAFNKEFSVNKDGTAINNNFLTKEQKELLAKMWAVQYDIVFGERFTFM